MADKARAAMGLMLTASALFAATSLIAKILGTAQTGAPGLPPTMVSFGRFGFAFCALVTVVTLRPALRPRFGGARWDLHLARSLCGWGGITCMFTAVARMPVAEASAISFLSPIATMALTIALLGESLTARKIAAAALALTGAMLIMRPGGAAFQPAALFALAAALLMGIEGYFIKRLSDSEPALRILLINNAMGASIASLVAVFSWQMPVPGQWGFMALLGGIMVSGQFLFIQSMKRADASRVIPGFYAVLVFAALYDRVLFGVTPGITAALGAAMIVAGALVLALRA